MTDETSQEAVSDAAGGPLVRDVAGFTIRKVPPPTAVERQARRDAMERAIKFGAAPYRDAEGSRPLLFRCQHSLALGHWPIALPIPAKRPRQGSEQLTRASRR